MFRLLTMLKAKPCCPFPHRIKEIAEKAGITKIEQAKLVGKLAAEKSKESGITTVVFDRNGYLYHGRVKALAEAAREGGLKF